MKGPRAGKTGGNEGGGRQKASASVFPLSFFPIFTRPGFAGGAGGGPGLRLRPAWRPKTPSFTAIRASGDEFRGPPGTVRTRVSGGQRRGGGRRGAVGGRYTQPVDAWFARNG